MKLAWTLLLVGCVASSDGEVSSEIRECRAQAAADCAALGFGDNETCLLVFAKLCSAEDAEAAREACVAQEGLPANAACCLKWR